MKKYLIEIWFLPNHKGKKYELVSIELTTKPCSFKRAEEIAELELDKTGWEFANINITPLGRSSK